MSDLPEIATLWIGERLSWLEQLCLQSFVDHGHRVTLYSYGDVKNVPQRVHKANAEDIYPGEPLLRHVRTGSPAIHADIWRLHLLAKTDAIWVDADMYCFRPFDFSTPFVFGWEKPDLVCNAVLGLPRNSGSLRNLLEFFEDEYAIAPWLKPWQQNELKQHKDQGRPIHMTEQKWGFTGPASVTHFLKETGEIEHAQKRDVFYPISFRDRNKMILSRHNAWVDDHITLGTHGVHFWARRMKPRLEEKENNKPRRGSFMHRLLGKRGIDTDAALIEPKVYPSDKKMHDENFKAMIGLSAIQGGQEAVLHICKEHEIDENFVRDCKDVILKNAKELFRDH